MKTTIAGIQMPFNADINDNLERTSYWVEQAAKRGAHIILPSELFEGLYFCSAQQEHWFDQANTVGKHPAVAAMKKIAAQLKVYIPCSFFEREGPHTFNSVAMIDSDGKVMGVYRKSHIPDGPGYQEKYYFKPGNSGFKVWATPFGNIGVGICWDQWFPEAARAMMLKGADILLYPTAIGSEPYDNDLDTSKIWQRAMQGHAVSNAVPVMAANRIGQEQANGTEAESQHFYGQSFIADHTGEIIEQLSSDEEGLVISSFDFEELRNYRSSWGFFRDRREDLY